MLPFRSTSKAGSRSHPRRLTREDPFPGFVQDQSGATAIEYGLIAALIAVAAIGAMTTLGGKLDTTFTSVANQLK